MDALVPELIKQLPSAAAIIAVAYLFLSAEERRNGQRAQTEEHRLEHERELNNQWATTVKQVSKEQTENFKAIVLQIQKHEDESRRRHSILKARKK